MLAAIAVKGKQVVQRTNLIAVVAIQRHRLNSEKAETPVCLGGRSSIVPEGEQSIGRLDRRIQMPIQKHGVELGFVLRKIVPVAIKRKQPMSKQRRTRFLSVQGDFGHAKERERAVVALMEIVVQRHEPIFGKIALAPVEIERQAAITNGREL